METREEISAIRDLVTSSNFGAGRGDVTISSSKANTRATLISCLRLGYGNPPPGANENCNRVLQLSRPECV